MFYAEGAETKGKPVPPHTHTHCTGLDPTGMRGFALGGSGRKYLPSLMENRWDRGQRGKEFHGMAMYRPAVAGAGVKAQG